MNSINISKRMDTIFMNSENSKISDPHRLIHNFLDKIDLNKSHKILAFTIHGKILKKNMKKTKQKINSNAEGKI